MIPDEARSRQHHYSDLQLKFIGFLLAGALGLLGWGFNNWSKAVETGMADVMRAVQRIEARSEKRDEAISDIVGEITILRERQQVIRDQIQRSSKENP